MSARAAITAIFVLDGIALGGWGARVPAVQEHAEVGPGGLAVALAALAAGALLAMPPAGRAASRAGSRRVVTVAVVGLGLALPLPALVPGLPAVAVAAFVLGAVNGALDVAMNAQGVAVERRRGRPILSSLHAGFSVGGLLGAGAGALAAVLAVPAAAQFAATGLLVAGAGALAGRLLIDDGPRAPASSQVTRGGAARWRLRGLAFCCLFAEGAAKDWSAVHLRSIGAAAAVAALAYAGFSLTMTAGRLVGDGLSLRWGAVRLARRGGLLASGAMAAALAGGQPWMALAAYVALGAGLAVVVPLIFRAASLGADAGPALAGVTTTGYLGFLAGPPIIGGLAAAASVPAALLLVVAATAAVGLGAGALAPRREPLVQSRPSGCAPVPRAA
jgi:MFS family permease